MYNASTQMSFYPTARSRAQGLLVGTRDWLDNRGRPGWLVAMVLGFVAFWPLGLAILTYMLWSKRMSGSATQGRTAPSYRAPTTGNSAFDAYRDETLRRLEDEHRDFLAFLEKLREAKDKAEFDQFMGQRDGDRDEAGRDESRHPV